MDPNLPSITIDVIGFCISLGACAIFAYLETSITALRLFKLKEFSQNSSERYKPLLISLEKNPHRMLITILVAVSLANVTAAALSTRIMETLFSQWNMSQGLGFSLGIAITTALILIIGEIIPKNFAKIHGERLFTSTLWLTQGLFYLLYPFVTFLMKISDVFMYRLGKKHSSTAQVLASEKEIGFMIDYITEQGLMEHDKSQMLRNILSIGQTPVIEIMVPGTDIISIPVEATIEDALDLFGKHQFSRFPVYEDETDNIIGFIHQKDVLLSMRAGQQDTSIINIIRPIMLVPESMRVNQLLREFKRKYMHIAMVVNEFGSITGLATLEDTLEEIVGEIHDEYETITDEIIKLKDGGLLVDGGIDLETLEEKINLEFVTEAITLGGFMSEQLQQVPKKGERITYKGYVMQIQKATHKRVTQVLIFKEKSK